MNYEPSNINLQHIFRLTNHVGIVQHAAFHIPNHHHGYCLDDNARALQLTMMVRHFYPQEKVENFIDIYFSYLLYMQKSNGNFHNFLGYNMQFLDDECTPDAFGRTIMALGAALKFDDDQRYRKITEQLLSNALPHINNLSSIRSVAYTLTGLIWIYQTYPGPHYLDNYISPLAAYIAREYSLCNKKDWNWFEEIISYDNAMIPYSLLLAYQITKVHTYKEYGILSTEFLDSILFKDDHLRLIGNDGWHCKGDLNNKRGQQPIEIPSLLLLYNLCKELNIDENLKGSVQSCYNWYFGLNSEKLVLYDKKTQGCHDGLEFQSVNLNQGAESTIAFWQSYLNYNNPF